SRGLAGVAARDPGAEGPGLPLATRPCRRGHAPGLGSFGRRSWVRSARWGLADATQPKPPLGSFRLAVFGGRWLGGRDYPESHWLGFGKRGWVRSVICPKYHWLRFVTTTSDPEERDAGPISSIPRGSKSL